MRFRDIRAVDLLWNLLLGLTCMFIVCKVVGVLDWPWWAVLSPFVVPLSIAWLIFIGLFVFWFAVLFYHRFCQLLKDKNK